tara:strand:+ start:21313 stop:22044 length:732 start_codon:yes stop_codon:yes gene_type:complete
MPLGAVLILMIIQILNKKKKPLFIAIIILWSFSTYAISNCLIKLVEYPWVRVNLEKVKVSDGIVVLSGGGIKEISGKNKIIEWIDPDRFFNAIALFKKGKGKRLFFTGGYDPLKPQSRTEGELYIEEAKKRGVSHLFISTTPRVINTKQEAIELSKSFKLDSDNSANKIILVTSAFHMQRAKKIFEREGFIVIAYPVDFKSSNLSLIKVFSNPYNYIPTAGSLNQSSIAIRELIGRVYYNVWK